VLSNHGSQHVKRRYCGKEVWNRTGLYWRQARRLLDEAIKEWKPSTSLLKVGVLRLALFAKGVNIFRMQAQVVNGKRNGRGHGVD